MCLHYVDELFLDSQDQSPKHLGDTETTEEGKLRRERRCAWGMGGAVTLFFERGMKDQG